VLPSTAEILAKGRALSARPVAIEAFWDGDTEGWYVVLTAIVRGASARHAQFTEIDLAKLSDGGDIRLFNNQVPPWPESVLAAEVGEQLARELGVPFHFLSRDQPRDECVRWWDRERGQPCADCGIAILQESDLPWFGVCYPCHLEREAKRPRVIVELLRDLTREDFEQVSARLVERGVGVCRSSTIVPGMQQMTFEVTSLAAAELAIAALRDAGRLADVRIRAARTAHERGELVWPKS